MKKQILFGLFVVLISATASASSLSDDKGGMQVGGYTLGINQIGGEEVLVRPVKPKQYQDALSCTGSDTSSSAVLVDNGDPAFKLMLAQIITSNALRQKVTFIFDDACVDGTGSLGYGWMFPSIIGVIVH